MNTSHRRSHSTHQSVAPICTHRRTRTLSILSTSSRLSTPNSFNIPKADSTVFVTGHSENYDAIGSFVPNDSAIETLQHLIKHPIPSRETAFKRLKLALREKHVIYDGDSDNTPEPSPVIPYITRTFPHGPRPHSQTSSSSSSSSSSPSPPKNRLSHDLHPVLASLERKSKLCTRKTTCSTCLKVGNDYPRCGRCGEMWCSRNCRLLEGKKHFCRPPATVI